MSKKPTDYDGAELFTTGALKPGESYSNLAPTPLQARLQMARTRRYMRELADEFRRGEVRMQPTPPIPMHPNDFHAYHVAAEEELGMRDEGLEMRSRCPWCRIRGA